MPRDGSGNYTQPHPDVVTGTTVESLIYNGFTHDVTIDLNAPRPVVAGGTGANNAADAINTLGGEVSKIQVTNYDSHPFQAGSFYSDAGAANAPVFGHSFSGQCYPAVVTGVATTNMFIEARDMDDPAAPPAVYVRQKKNNLWSSWMVPAAGGADPTFSGIIKLNGRPILSSPISPLFSNNLLDVNGNVAVATGGAAAAISQSTYFGDTQTFKTRNGVTTFAAMNSSEFALSVTLTAGIATCVAPALTDKSTRVPTTSWVKDTAIDLIKTTPDLLPQVIMTGNLSVNENNVGGHYYHPASDTATRALTLNNIDKWAVGAMLTIVNFGGTLNLQPDGNAHLFLAGTSLSGNRTMTGGGGAVSIAQILKVAGTASTSELIIWGHGIT